MTDRPLCSYCQRPAHLLQAVGKRPCWTCAPCDAVAAVVPDSIATGEFTLMGRFLKPDGVKLKKKVLREFKGHWKRYMELGNPRTRARDRGYKDLAAAMGRKVHIEALDVADLKLVIEALRGMNRSTTEE